ncbi:USH1C-binding protein 1 [uncultured Bilophila sp.]|uniref:USH1C-binding protein 1 n=1 Tax=uncultured Bilophila sp. TaxID=529385 RepID=UPI0026DA775C|nr:USH1C-binding protein 1 [uncultured Bilophila sp.]
MSQGVGGVGGSGSVSGVGSLGTCTSVNFVFAKLQMELAASAKDSALGYIKQVQKAQTEQKKVAQMLTTCRGLQDQAKAKGGCTEMPADIREFMDKNKLEYSLTTGGVKDPTRETADSLHDKDEWDVAIQSLQSYQETIGTDIQTLMVYVQDFMGQYNSYTQGANSAIQSGMQTLTAVARGQ